MSSTSTAKKKECPAAKATAITRETDGSVQLVGYPGWRLIIERIEKKKGAA